MYYKMKEIPESINFIIVKRNTDALIEDIETAIGKALGLTNEDEKLPFTIHTRNYLAKELVKEGYRKVGEDKQIVNTEQLNETLNSILEVGKRMGYAQGRDETAREFLHKIKDYIDNSMGGYLLIERKDIRDLATALGIELE